MNGEKQFDHLVSVIIPVYNVEAYLDECIQHVIKQSYSNWELILIDDGSTDRSPGICDNYALYDNRIKVIHQTNAGVSKARNAGLRAATGDFVIFCDSDDWLSDNALAFFIELQTNNNADIVFGDICAVKGFCQKQVRLFNQDFAISGTKICIDILRACIGYGYNPYPTKPYAISGLGSVGNKLFRLDIIRREKLEYTDDTNGIYEDNLFTIQYLLRSNSACYKSVPVYYYRQTENSSIHRYRPESLETSRKVFEKVLELINSLDDHLSFINAFYVLVIRRLSEELRVYYFHKDRNHSINESCRELHRMIRSEPYAKAIHKVELTRLLPVHKMTAIVARSGSAYLLWLFFVMRSFAKRWL